MELTNKQVSYDCVNTNENLKISGTIHFNGDGVITQFSGTFTDLNSDAHCGDFYYNENAEGKVNRSTNNIPLDLVDTTGDFLLETVA